MEKKVSIVLSPSSANYRKVAQQNWGLTDEQMKGKHVHHHPPVSEGGRNIPEHLYVCSPSMHTHGWHDGDYFIEQATSGGAKGCCKGGQKGGKTRGKQMHAERDEQGRSLWTLRLHQERDDLGRSIRGVKLAERTHSKKNKDGKSTVAVLAANTTNSQKWMCTETGKVSTAGPLTIYQKSKGIDPVNRVKVE
jgi:hypothetical protein